MHKNEISMNVLLDSHALHLPAHEQVKMLCNSYTMSMSTLPDIYTLAQGLQAQWQVYIYIRQSTSAYGITNSYVFLLEAGSSNSKLFIAIPLCYIENQINCDCGIKFCHQILLWLWIQYY